MKIGSCRLDGRTGHAAAWHLLEQMYCRETGENLPPVGRTERGKPYFLEGDWKFSLSHTKRHAFCVMGKKNVAIDAEELDRQINPELAEKILSPGELLQYRRAPDKNRALLTFWVLKEAAAKLSGEGLRGYPRNTNFSLEDPRVSEMDGCLVAVMEGENNAV